MGGDSNQSQLFFGMCGGLYCCFWEQGLLVIAWQSLERYRRRYIGNLHRQLISTGSYMNLGSVLAIAGTISLLVKRLTSKGISENDGRY